MVTYEQNAENLNVKACELCIIITGIWEVRQTQLHAALM